MGDACARILHVPLSNKFLHSGGGMHRALGESMGFTLSLPADFSFHPRNDNRRDVEIKLLSLG